MIERHMVLVAAMALVACQGSNAEHGGAPHASRQARPLLINGSTTLYPAVSAGAEQFVRSHPDVVVAVSQSSSGAGVAGLIAGEIDIATAARSPTAEEFNLAFERDIALKTYQIGYDAVVVIVHPDKYRYVTTITRDQAHAIFFAGSITDWSQLHARASGAITPYVRDPRTSGTAAEVAEHFTGSEGSPFTERGVLIDFTPEVTRRVAGDPSGIGFVPFTLADDTVRMLAFGASEDNLVMPSVDNIHDLRYPLRRDLFLVTRGTPSGASNQFIQYMLGSEGQAFVTAARLIPLH